MLRGPSPCPCRGKRGSPCFGGLSPAPLDICQLGNPVLVGVMCSEPGWAKLAQCQACQESSNRSLSPTPKCPGCPDFLDLAEPVPLCPRLSPRPQMTGKSHPDRMWTCHQPLLGPAARAVTLYIPPSPRDPSLLCPVLTISLGTASHPLGAVPVREETITQSYQPSGARQGRQSARPLCASPGPTPPPGRTHRALRSLNSSRTLLSSSCRRARSLATESRVLRASPSSAS